jgi:hypothetical protein
MRFLKSKRGSQSPEGEALAERLNAISARGRLEKSDAPAEESAAPAQIRQVFWTPSDLTGASRE